jgi:uncharacterized Tic20 family protein
MNSRRRLAAGAAGRRSASARGPDDSEEVAPMGAGTGTPPTRFASGDERMWAVAAHLGGIAPLVVPVVALLAKGNESPTVREHAVEALNFQLTWAAALVIAAVVSVCSFGFLWFLPLVVWFVMIVFSVIGAVRANEGHLYRYPVAVRTMQ